MTDQDDIVRLENKIKELESEVRDMQINQAVNTERYGQIVSELKQLHSEQREARADQKWLFRLVIGAIIIGVIDIVLKGGLGVFG